jgi:hypothetical protein
MSWFRKKPSGPPSPHPGLRARLFADAGLADAARLNDDDPDTPGTRFHAALAALSVGDRAHARQPLHDLLRLPKLESRTALQAWCCLRELGEVPAGPDAAAVRGVVVEIGTEAGLETVAAYEDRTAVFLARNGAVLTVEHPECGLDDRIEALLARARGIAARTAPSGGRDPAPAAGHAAIHVLTYAGPCSSLGPAAALEQDPLLGPVLRAANELMRDVYDQGSAVQNL